MQTSMLFVVCFIVVYFFLFKLILMGNKKNNKPISVLSQYDSIELKKFSEVHGANFDLDMG